MISGLEHDKEYHALVELGMRDPEGLLRRVQNAQCAGPGGLKKFVKLMWKFVEPARDFVDGWHIDAICEHLEAVTSGQITRLLINVPPGFCKAISKDAMVLTRRGRICLGDVVVGDEILTHRGRFRKVLAVHDQGLLPTLTVTTEGGRIIHAEHDHPFLTPRGWIKAEDLRLWENLAAVSSLEAPGPDYVTIEEARLLGYLVGDGSVTHSPNFTNADEDVLFDFQRCADVCGFSTTVQPASPSHKKKNAIFTRIGLRGALRWLEKHNLRRKNSYTKRIPEAVLRSGPNVIANFLGAYWSCDGTIRVRHTGKRGSIYLSSCTTVGYDLAFDIQHALIRIGIDSRIHRRDAKLETKAQPGGRYISYNVMTCNWAEVAKFADLPGLSFRKRLLCMHLPPQRFFQGPLFEDKIIDIQEGANADCRCLTVEEDCSFTANDIAVHNSLITNVFFPSWEWAPMKLSHLRYMCVSYSQDLTIRDNVRFRQIITGDDYVARWPHVQPSKDQFSLTKAGNTDLGWKLASSVSGIGTGERADRVICLAHDVVITTNKGGIPIGEIVDACLPVRIAGWNGTEIVLQDIEAYEINPGSELVEVEHEHGTIAATDDHPVWIYGKGYIGIQHVKPGDKVIQCTSDKFPPGLDYSTVRTVKRTGRIPDQTYNLRVAPHHNYFANGILVHNCDDPNSIKDAESDKVRDSTNMWYSEVLPSRLNSPKTSAIITIQQRTHEEDVSGLILSRNLGYEHLMIPMRYDSSRRYVSCIGWTDPRGLDENGCETDENDGSLAWPEMYGEKETEKLESAIGPYATAGQLQQTPVPRGGVIFDRDWWQPWEIREDGKIVYPPFDYVMASVDTAFTEKQENDYSAMTVWGVWRDDGESFLAPRYVDDPTEMQRVASDTRPKCMLIAGWQKRLSLHGPPDQRPYSISDDEWNSPYWRKERQKTWGLVEWVVDTAKRWRIDRLLIETQAAGHTLNQELRRLHSGGDWDVQMISARGDKKARAIAVQHLFSNGLIYVPTYADGRLPGWADIIVSQFSSFPRTRHKDIVDSGTHALQHLRDAGLLMRKDEFEDAYLDELQHRAPQQPLYDV